LDSPLGNPPVVPLGYKRGYKAKTLPGISRRGFLCPIVFDAACRLAVCLRNQWVSIFQKKSEQKRSMAGIIGKGGVKGSLN
jgi:hypothetical protein